MQSLKNKDWEVLNDNGSLIYCLYSISFKELIIQSVGYLKGGST